MSNSTSQESSTPQHSVSVAGVVIREDGRVLVIRRADNGAWEPPGGVLERGETVEEGVRREVLEETGVEVRVGALTGVYKNMALGVVALVFRCTPEGGYARKSDEAVAVEWVAAGRAADGMSEVYGVRITDALRDSGPCVRAHDGRVLLPSG
jgi:ADP-ribose pyrophosphatase YjhB (NUDIX family)